MVGPRLSVQQEVHDLDSLLKPLGGFGKFQILNTVCICTIVVLCTFSELGYVFTAAELKHRCVISECEDSNAAYDDPDKPWLKYAIPKKSNGFSCTRFNSSFSTDLKQCNNGSFTADEYECHEFIYETEEWTIAREDWGLHCEGDRYKLGLVGSLNNAGQVVGGLFAGFLQDKYGRKLVIVTLTLFVVLMGAIKSFCVNYAMMLAMEVIEASAAVALFNGPFVLAMEVVDPSKRVLVGTLVSLAYPCGEMLMGLVQYLTLDWRNTLRICYLPFLLVAAYYWILPESVRWLLSKGRAEDAIAVLRKLARMNGTHLPEETVKEILAEEAERTRQEKLNLQSEKNRFSDLFRSKIMRWRLLCTYLVWVCTIFVYFAMTMNSIGITDDKFVNFILSGLIEIPGYFFVYFTLDRLGRKKIQGFLMIVCGIACVFDAYIPQDDQWSWARLVLYLIGKFGAAGALFVVDVYTTELFPTFVRSTIMSTGLLFGKIATIVAPEVPLLGDIYGPLPLLIFGCMSLVGVLALITFPETLNCKLPDTIEEAENLGKTKNNEKT